ncbi:proteinase-activated receptor 3 [Rhinichthys klamathensis goyatoka]|uniref:proteinase-activated receptor 3 n=1 Tax=Rhinichthys klamathensis goyatoka TaxID=3034132 RepID=UPI0024B603E4|nr:proteinase-activated receptor 3 [Rhinichthys klamathensis goyatoka]
MWRTFVLLLLPFMFEDSLQDSASIYTSINMPKQSIHPKTFPGTIVFNSSLFSNTSIQQPVINASDKVIDYITGIVSTRIIPSAYILAILIGIPSNVFVLACLSGRKNLSSGILYFSLAVSDLLLLLSLTLRVHYHVNNNDWIFGELACKVVTACFYGNTYCSIHAHMCISVMRYLAVVHPFLYRTMSKRYCAIWSSLTMWVVFAIAMAPEFLVQQSYRVSGEELVTCHDIQPYKEASYKPLIPYRLSLICLGFILPSLVIAFVYGSIIYHLNCSSRDWKHYMKASTLVFGIFLVCFTPCSALLFAHYVKLYSEKQFDLYYYYRAAVCLCSFHSCLDPFLSYLLTKTSTSQVKFRSFSSRPLTALSTV